MIQIGKAYSLYVSRIVDFGVYLDAENLGEILLPRKFVPAGLDVGDSVHAFLYQDSEDRPVATTVMPKAMAGEFAYLPVVDVNPVGAFLGWGLEKDLLVPFSEQHRRMQVGHSYLVHIYLDKVHGRITASSRIDRFLEDSKPGAFKAGQAVDLIIANSTELGYKAIVNHKVWGVLHKNDVDRRLSFGESIRGYIKHIRPDGKIDLALQSGGEIRDRHASVVLAYLKSRDGFAPVHDKSPPQLIAEEFGMSKAAFKRAIGNLYSQKVIEIEKDGIRLAGNDIDARKAPK